MQSESFFYDHYKDSFEQQKNYLNERNRLTVYLAFLVAIMLLMSSNSYILIEISSALQEHKIGKVVIDFNIVTTALYFVLMWLTMRYYQINLTIEKTYTYLDRCEKDLSRDGTFKIDREGGDYEKNYPWLKMVVHRIYVYVFPLLIITVSVISIIHELCYTGANKCFNIFFLSMTIILSVLYLINRIFGK